MSMCCCLNGDSLNPPIQTDIYDFSNDRAVLMRFYKDNAGDSWKRNTNWGNMLVPLRTWWGITVDPDEPEKIAILDLSHNKIYGHLPPYFAALTSLQELYLHNNCFTGKTRCFILRFVD